MKISRMFIVALVVLFAFMVLLEFNRPVPFVWEHTAAHSDRNPLGCAVIDSIMAASLPNGYYVTPETPAQILRSNEKPNTYVIVCKSHNYGLDSVEQRRLLNLLNYGHNVVVFTAKYHYIHGFDENDNYGPNNRQTKENNPLFTAVGLDNILTAIVSDLYFNEYILKDIFSSKRYVTYHWKANCAGYPTELASRSLTKFHNACLRAHAGTPLITSEYKQYDLDKQVKTRTLTDTIAMMFTYKSGKLIVVSDPLLFTNISALTFDQMPMLMRIFSNVADRPIFRLDPSETKQSKKFSNSESQFRVLLEHDPLRWALYLTIALVALAMFFTARRRQRVIPIIKPPANLSLGMIEHIGSLYFRRHDNADLLRKKYNFFIEEVRRATMIDLDDTDHFADNLLVLQQVTGIPRNELSTSLSNIGKLIENGEKLSNTDLMKAIDFLNNVLKKL